MKQSAYKEAGVDIDKAASLVERIKPHVKKTNRSGVVSGLGGFGALFDLKETGYKDPIIVSATDGVGTKIKIAIDMGIHNTIGIDAVAMCVNDLIVQGAEPLFFLDYFACGKLDNDVAEAVIASIAKGCELSGSALIGGETAEMPGVYQEQDYDIAGFSVGAVERDDIITGEHIKEGDVIIGLPSSGVHSNGFSLVRHLLKSAQGFEYDTVTDFSDGKTLGEILLTPTKIYVKPVLEALKIRDEAGHIAVRGMSHITGGGFIENIPRVLPDTLAADIDTTSWDMPALFKWLKDIGDLSNSDLATTLNCGIGFMLIAPDKYHADILHALHNNGEKGARVIGKIVPRADKPVIMNGMDQAWA